jgi:hypothetical protein
MSLACACASSASEELTRSAGRPFAVHAVQIASAMADVRARRRVVLIIIILGASHPRCVVASFIDGMNLAALRDLFDGDGGEEGQHLKLTLPRQHITLICPAHHTSDNVRGMNYKPHFVQRQFLVLP